MKTLCKYIIAALLFIIELCTDVSVCAQIKEVGDEYTNSLTASKSYYEKDVDFEIIFPKISLKEKYSITESNLNDYRTIDLTGDTVYLKEDMVYRSRGDYFIDTGSRKSFCVTKNGEMVPDTIFMPKGYYIISGYVLCSENEDLVRASYGLDYGREKYYQKSDWDRSTIKELQEDILMGKGSIENYIRYIVFQSVDTVSKKDNEAVIFYLQKKDVWGGSYNLRAWEKMVPLSFYNEASSFVGEKVVLTSNGWKWSKEVGNYKWDMVANNAYDSLYRDPLSDRLVKIKDEVFQVRDVVMKDKNFYIVLDGEKTGSFSYKLLYIEYANNCWDMYRHDDMMNYLKSNNPRVKDIPCLISLSSNTKNWNHDIIIIKKNDIAVLENRAAIEEEQREKEWKQQEKREQQERERKNADFIKKMLSKYGDEYGAMIGEKQIAIGMTKEMCKDAWGRPMNTYSTTTSFGQSEVWHYNYKTRVYFRNGKVTQIDN